MLVVHISALHAEYLGKHMLYKQLRHFLKDNGLQLRYCHNFRIMGKTWEIVRDGERVGYAYVDTIFSKEK